MHINKAGLNALSFLWKILLFHFVESYQDVVITTSQTVDKALLLQGFAIVGTAFLI